MPKRSSSDATGKGVAASASAGQPFVQRKVVYLLTLRRGEITANRKPLLQTERSHEENQERAYIAASRRSDRSLEARVQSARMASEIHKKRTGKSFRITEEIVRKEEMYEEEEDEFPRSYRLLGSHMQTASAEMNSKLEAYMSSRLAMSAYMSKMNDNWRENNINQMFAAAFPNLGQQAQQLSPGTPQPAMFPDTQIQQGAAGPQSPSFQQVNYQDGVNRNHSFSTASPTEPIHDHPMSPSPLNHNSSDGSAELQRGSFAHSDTPKAMPNLNRATDSPFTNELPQEMKLLLSGPDGMDFSGFNSGMPGQTFMSTDGFYNPEFSGVNKLGELEAPPQDLYGDDSWDTMAQSMDEPWDTFINDAAWDSNVQ